MADFFYVKDVPGQPTEIEVNATIIAGTDEEINAALGNLNPGTIIHTVGYGTIKQKGLDNTWTTI